MTEAIAFFQRGGPVMWVLLALAAGTFAILIDRGLYFCFTHLPGAQKTADWEKLLQTFQNQPDPAQALREHLASQMSAKRQRLHFLWQAYEPLQMAESLLVRQPSSQQLKRLGEELIWRMNRRIQGLAVLSQIAPLLGLLGTIAGMISAFAAISASQNPSMAALATGIWEALITTAAGLCVAIPAHAGHAWLEGIVAHRIHLMNSVAGLLLPEPIAEEAAL